MDWMAHRGGNTDLAYGGNRQLNEYNNYNRSSVISLSADNKTVLSISNNNNDDCSDVIKSSELSDDVIKDDDSDDGNGSDAEGIWSADIEQSFLEALAIYPPCGRRKIILSDEGKMYGRNELIARYIKLRTGKTRTRKQVSSHIQVLARRKSKEIQSHIKDQTSRERVLQSLASMSSSQIVSATSLNHRNSNKSHSAASIKPMTSSAPRGFGAGANHMSQYCTPGLDAAAAAQQPVLQFWSGMEQRIQDVKLCPQYPVPANTRFEAESQSLNPVHAVGASGQASRIVAPQLQLVNFTSFVALADQSNKMNSRHNLVQLNCRNAGTTDHSVEVIDIHQIQDKFPDTSDGLKDLFSQGPKETSFFAVKFVADLNTSLSEQPGAFYGVTYQFESSANMTLSVSTKVCSFGKQVVEKIETESASCCDQGRYVYCINRSPMCEYMVSFINRLKDLPESYMMNSVLENFTVLQTVRNHDTHQLLLCVAYMFEVSAGDRAAECDIFRIE